MNVGRVTWSNVTVAQQPSGCFALMLDDRALVSIGNAVLETPSGALAQALAAEWGALKKGDLLRPDQTPMTQLLATQLNRIKPRRCDATAQLLEIFKNDALVYQPHGTDLKDDLASLFHGVRSHFEGAFALNLPTANGIMSPDFSSHDLDRVYTRLASQSDAILMAYSVVASMTGSLILAYAVVHGRVSPESAVEIAHIEENVQSKRWGDDPSRADEQKREVVDLRSVVRYLHLLES